MEQLDILDEKGNKTGLTKSKDQVHVDGDWHRNAHIWFINPKGELLIQLRSKAKLNYPDMWDISAAGHISAGEDSETSALREIEEEIGICLQKSDLHFLGSVTRQTILNEGTYIENEFNDIYLVEIPINIEKLNFQDGEVAEAQLIPWKEFRGWIDEGREDVVPHPGDFELLFKYFEKLYK